MEPDLFILHFLILIFCTFLADVFDSSGSNTSIPDLVRQHSSEKLLHTRPASATTRKLRPPSGKKPRPQSAKEPLPTLTQDTGQTFGGRYSKTCVERPLSRRSKIGFQY